jgi:tRNA-methyltransferase O
VLLLEGHDAAAERFLDCLRVYTNVDPASIIILRMEGAMEDMRACGETHFSNLQTLTPQRSTVVFFQ